MIEGDCWLLQIACSVGADANPRETPGDAFVDRFLANTSNADYGVVDPSAHPMNFADSVYEIHRYILEAVHSRFPLPWSHYARLLGVKNVHARAFYESEALRGGWTSRHLDRQIQCQFYERTAFSQNKAAILRKGPRTQARDTVTPDEEIKDPYVLEFLALKDEYSETELEGALIENPQALLLELGGDFTFVGRQRRLRVGGEWYRVDLLFFTDGFVVSSLLI